MSSVFVWEVGVGRTEIPDVQSPVVWSATPLNLTYRPVDQFQAVCQRKRVKRDGHVAEFRSVRYEYFWPRHRLYRAFH